MFAAIKARWPGRSRRRALGAALAGAALLGAVGAGLAWMRPGWWPGAAPDAALAEPFENAVVRQMTAPREPERAPVGANPGEWRSEPWAVSISEADVNAWLATRLEAWLANRDPSFTWPPGVSRPRVRFEEGLVRVGVVLGGGGDGASEGGRVLSVAFVPRVDEAGALWLDGGAVRMGRLPIPASAAWELGPGGALEQAVGALAGRSALARRAAVRLEGGRWVRVLSVKARAGRLEVVCRTEGGG